MKLLLLFFIFFSVHTHSQNYKTKQIDFENTALAAPISIPLILAGNFGEMRANHFHTGLDIKTLGVEGQEIFAVEDGYISRLRNSEYGYGKAIYVDHPNGLTSLYAHLSRFPAAIESLLYAQQKRLESDVIDENVLIDSFFVKKGQLIGYSGNSGSSFAPHLHFEIRETATENAINPLLFDCYRSKIKDSTPPTMTGIKLYAISDKGYMIPGKSIYYSCTKGKDFYEINNGEPLDISALMAENSLLGIGFQTTDRLDAAGNICGIHHTTLTKDGIKRHDQQIDYLIFDQNRFMNSHQDYFEFKQNKKDIHKNFTTVINPLEIYPMNDGKFDWKTCAGKYEFKAVDVHGNSIVLQFSIGPNLSSNPSKNPFDQPNTYLFPDSVNTYLKDDFQVLMEAGCFYEPLQIVYRKDPSSAYFSDIFQFGEENIPVQSKFDVRIKTRNLPPNFPIYKLGIASISEQGGLSFIGGNYIDGWVECQPRKFGRYVVVVDSVAPVITALDFTEGKTITKFSTLELSIADNLAGLKEYKAYLNGEWVLMNYNRKKGRYIIPLDSHSKPLLVNGKNELRITSKDYKGNESVALYSLVY